VKIAATIQARTGSTRLPGKVLLPIVGKPMLALQVERIRRSLLIDEVVIATSRNPNDDVIEELARQIGVSCFRGSEEKVLDRVMGALKQSGADLQVEFYGDCPLPEPAIIDAMIGIYLKNRDSYDYVGTGMKTTFPPGLDVTVYPTRVLYETANVVSDRGYVAVNVRSHVEPGRVLNVEAPMWYRYPDVHLEVDTLEDFRVVSAIYEGLYPGNPYFVLADIIGFLRQNPSLAEANRSIPRRWKAYRPLDKEERPCKG